MKKKRTFRSALIVVVILLISSCAVSYQPIKPESYYYSAAEIENGVSFSYKYDVLRSSGNKRYADKELENGLRIIAVQITNQSDTAIRLSRDYDFYAGDTKTLPMNVGAISNRLKQNVPSYYLYLLLTFTQLNYRISSPNSEKTGSIPIGLVLGPGITLLNVTKASTANRKLSQNLYEADIWNRDIQKGETAYGLIGLEGRDIVPIHFRKK